MSEEKTYKVSVVIITRDRSFIVEDCLKALERQLDHARHEVILVDSSPDKKTEEIAAKFPYIKYFRIQLPLGTRPQSYSYGAQQASGEIVALLDDDSIVYDHWLENIEACYDDPEVGAAGGRVLPKDVSSLKFYDEEVPIGEVTPDGRIISNLYIDTEKKRDVHVLRGCNMSIRKDLLAKGGFFDARLTGQNCRVEDDVCLWVKRFGYKVVYDPKAVVCHLAEQRPDIPRSETNMRSEFYVCRNTVWLYAKHFGWGGGLTCRVAFMRPFIVNMRRVLGGSFKKPRINAQTLSYFPAAVAGIAGGVWGFLCSLIYSLKANRTQNSTPRLRFDGNRLVRAELSGKTVS